MKHTLIPSENCKRELSVEEAFSIISCPLVNEFHPGKPHYHARFMDAVSVIETALDKLQEVEHE